MKELCQQLFCCQLKFAFHDWFDVVVCIDNWCTNLNSNFVSKTIQASKLTQTIKTKFNEKIIYFRAFKEFYICRNHESLFWWRNKNYLYWNCIRTSYQCLAVKTCGLPRITSVMRNLTLDPGDTARWIYPLIYNF